jgi:hypothetical protein
MHDVIAAEYVGGYTLWLRFDDGTSGEIDLTEDLYGEVFEPLKDIGLFRQFLVNPDTGTIEWPNRADFAHEFLYEKLQVTA